MARTARASVGGICYHVINRGNGRETVFRTPEDYEAFVALLAAAAERVRPDKGTFYFSVDFRCGPDKGTFYFSVDFRCGSG